MNRYAVSLRTRARALGAAGAVMFAGVAMIAASVAALFGAQADAIAGSEGELQRVLAEASAQPVLREQLRDLSSRVSRSPGILRGKSLAAAQTELQQNIESIASSVGASIRSTQMLPPERANRFGVVEIQYDLTTPMSKLADFTYAIESQVPFMFLRGVQIAGDESWQSGSKAQKKDIQLNVRWTVRGYRWSANL